jgi:Putative exonuclease SbcCD, C subunit
VPGFRAARSGTEYKSWVARDLFGFADRSRLDAVVRMLKVLRTPHLGQRLDPDFFSAQMRDALPAIAQGEIDELAEGWDQLDALAADRDHAEAARNAVTSYVRRAWNPWADAILRHHADDLAASVTRFDNVTRAVRAAEDVLGAAKKHADGLESQLRATRAEYERVEQNYEDLLKSPAYQNAYDATAHVGQLKEAARRSRVSAGHADDDAKKAETSVSVRAETLTGAEDAVADVAQNMTAARSSAEATAHVAGLPADAHAWAGDGDVGRLGAAVSDRRQRLAAVRKLLSSAELARQTENAAASRAKETVDESARRAEIAVRADAALEETLQILSDDLEGWAATLGEGAPLATQRSDWISAVMHQSGQSRPHEVLGKLLSDAWLTPMVTPLRERAAVDEREAARLARLASERDKNAAAELAAPEPEPAPPVRWTRRDRPKAGPGGAPVWRLLDPRKGLPRDVLDHVEAGLDAAGLLDAWVTPDRAWLVNRDGNDIVLTAAGGEADLTAGSTGGSTLASVLRPAEDAGPLTARMIELLDAIGYQQSGEGSMLTRAYGLSADGRWCTPSAAGQAGVSEHGAELIGTAARSAARDRRVRALREEATQLREQAAMLLSTAAGLRAHAGFYDRSAAQAPGDADVVRAALAVGSAGQELRKARAADERAQSDLEKAQVAARDANSALLSYAGDHSLPMAAPAMEELAVALDAVATAIAELKLAAANLRAARKAEDLARGLHREAEDQARIASERAEEARRRADRDQDIADNAEESLGQSARDLLHAAEEQKGRKGELKNDVERLEKERGDQQGRVASAAEKLANAGKERQEVERARDAALAAWWIPVDAGLAAARNLPAESGRALTHALAQARAAREILRPQGWPDGTDASVEKESRVHNAWSRVVGSPLVELRAILEASGGRGVAVLDADENGNLSAIVILVDSTGEQSDPIAAIIRLDEQVKALANLHDQKMQQVLIELLSSTFVEHLRERLATVVELIRGVNLVLSQHPTGANATTLRIRRLPAEGQKTAFGVLQALESEFIDSEIVQNQVRAFLEQQIREAQDQGRSGATDWKKHLSVLLDYRHWFDIVTDYRVGDKQWRPLTKEVHAKDSGGGKVVTLLQPLVATLVALYGEHAAAPRPLWLDEAFTGVDDANRSTMLALLVTFDLDFLLAGPATLVTTAHVPSAAVWFINRAPAPDPGVDLSLLLWVGNALTQVDVSANTLAGATPRPPGRDAESSNLFNIPSPVAS